MDAATVGSQRHTIDRLVPHTFYKVKVKAANTMGDGPSIQITVQTDEGNPPPLSRPVIIQNEMTDEFISIALETASERNGPIR